MAYATVRDVSSAISGDTIYDETLIQRLIDKATVVMDAYIGDDADGLNPDLLRECCVDMVTPYLRNHVGEYYDSEINYDAQNGKPMDVPFMYMRLFGWHRRSTRIGSVHMEA